MDGKGDAARKRSAVPVDWGTLLVEAVAHFVEAAGEDAFDMVARLRGHANVATRRASAESAGSDIEAAAAIVEAYVGGYLLGHVAECECVPIAVHEGIGSFYATFADLFDEIDDGLLDRLEHAVRVSDLGAFLVEVDHRVVRVGGVRVQEMRHLAGDFEMLVVIGRMAAKLESARAFFQTS